MKSKWILGACLLASVNAQAWDLKGKIRDAQTGEEIIGASVVVKEEPTKGAVTGLDGSFNLSVGRKKYTLVCSYVGYQKYEVVVDGSKSEIEIPLKSDDVLLEGITVIASNPGRTEAGSGTDRGRCPGDRKTGDECGERHECQSHGTFSGHYSGKCHSAYVGCNGGT